MVSELRLEIKIYPSLCVSCFVFLCFGSLGFSCCVIRPSFSWLNLVVFFRIPFGQTSLVEFFCFFFRLLSVKHPLVSFLSLYLVSLFLCHLRSLCFLCVLVKKKKKEKKRKEKKRKGKRVLQKEGNRQGKEERILSGELPKA